MDFPDHEVLPSYPPLAHKSHRKEKPTSRPNSHREGSSS